MRVSSFLERNDYSLSYSGSSQDNVMSSIAADHSLSVSPGVNGNHAHITIQYSKRITLNLKLRDLYQEKSSMTRSMEDSVREDTSSADYDYWDVIPGFGVVELYEFDLDVNEEAREEEIEALFILLDNFLRDTFNLHTYRSREIAKIKHHMQSAINSSYAYLHDGEICYRPRMYG